MSNSKCVYYKEKEQKSIDGGITWVDTGNFRKGALISTQASQCGSFVTEYRWTKADYVCDNANKYKGYKQQVSYDNGGNWSDTGVVDIGSLIESNSRDCGYDEQWFVLTGDNDFICDEGSKYKKKEMKYTRDSGTTWNSFDTPRYEKGDLIEETSSDCASMKVTYTDGTTKYFTGLTSIQSDTDSNKQNAKSVEIYNGVKTIGHHAFYGCTSLTGVTIPDSVTSIGFDAFGYCTSLTSITIPNSVTDIGEEAFYGCSSLTSVTIPDSVTRIADYTFQGCSSLTDITIPNSVRTIGDEAFMNCQNLTSVKIPDSVKEIGVGAFNQCENLTGVTIPDSVTSIGAGAFNLCLSLQSIDIPDSVTSIGSYAFDGCSSLRTMTVNAVTPPQLGHYAIPNNIQRIYVPAESLDAYKTANGWKDYADKIWAIGYNEQWFVLTGDSDFICSEGSKYKKKEMKYTRDSGTTWNSFDPPKYEKGDLIESNSKDCPFPSMKVTYTDNTEKTFYNLTSIDEKTDSNKVNAKEVEIYDAVTTIGNDAFYGCRSLTGVTIGNAVTVIGGDAFNGCSGLTSVTIPDSVTSIGALAFQDCSALTGITIPNSVTSIGSYAFCNCRNLTSITIPEHVASINTGVFQDCSGLTSVTIPDSVKTIGNWAFYECEKLTGVTIPNSVTNIGNFAFTYCNGLTSIIIPDSVTSIGRQTFQGCFNLRTMTVEATTPPTLGSYAISPDTIPIYVPADSLDAYKTADGWKDYSSRIFAIGTIPTPSMKVTYTDGTEKKFYGLSSIENNTDANKANVKEVEIYDGVTAIGSNVFYACRSLTGVTIANSVTYIGLGAFQGCSSLTGITIPNSVTKIDDYAFYNSGLKTMTVQATTPPQLGHLAIPTTISRIYVPADSVAAYKSADGWKDFASKIQAIP